VIHRRKEEEGEKSIARGGRLISKEKFSVRAAHGEWSQGRERKLAFHRGEDRNDYKRTRLLI